MTVDFTVANEYTLPSEGKVYSQEINPTFKLRSMTTSEEMKRLNHSDKPNKNICEIIDDCLVEKIGISAYDLCLADFQFVLNKLRIVTYGPTYKLSSRCPWCGTDNMHEVNLDELNIIPFDEDAFRKYSEFELPYSKNSVTLRMQTPRILDSVAAKVKDVKKKYPNFSGDPNFLFTVESLIDTIDDHPVDRYRLPDIIRKMPMMDTNYIIKSAQKLNELFGVDKQLNHECSTCGLDYTGNFRTTPEFFGPSID